jgi:outer membrane biosynthesis protein TonB
MDKARETSASPKSLSSGHFLGISGALLLALSLAPTVHAQSQSQSPSQTPSPVPAQTETQKSAPAPVPTDAKSQTAPASQPEMQTQSGPPPESLGDAARRAKAQKTKTATPRVYTEESLSGMSGHGVSTVGQSNSGAQGSSASGNSYANPDSSSAVANNEQYWRGRARTIRDQMAGIDQRISNVQDEIAKHGAIGMDASSGLQAGVIFIEDRNAQIKQLEKQKADLQGQLDSLEDEGRKVGADSGWFR